VPAVNAKPRFESGSCSRVVLFGGSGNTPPVAFVRECLEKLERLEMMTEQATLTPELAIMAVSSARCLTCPDDPAGGMLPCPACVDADGKPTGARFPTLRVECVAFFETTYSCPSCGRKREEWTYPGRCGNCVVSSNATHHSSCSCDGRGWSPVSPDDWKTITTALEADGFPVRYLYGQWNVSHPGADRFPLRDCAVLAIAADRAIKAEATDG
jgi:hypothetical protein